MENEFVQYPIPGKKYQHYKGGIYEVIAVGRHSETKEILVTYKSLIFGDTVHRPLHMWFENVNTSFGIRPRFWEYTEFNPTNILFEPVK